MNQPYNEYYSVTFGEYVAIATKPVHRLQIRPIVHNIIGNLYHSPNLHPGTCSSVGVRQGTDTHTHTSTQTDRSDYYTFRLAMPNATRNH